MSFARAEVGQRNERSRELSQKIVGGDDTGELAVWCYDRHPADTMLGHEPHRLGICRVIANGDERALNDFRDLHRLRAQAGRDHLDDDVPVGQHADRLVVGIDDDDRADVALPHEHRGIRDRRAAAHGCDDANEKAADSSGVHHRSFASSRLGPVPRRLTPIVQDATRGHLDGRQRPIESRARPFTQAHAYNDACAPLRAEVPLHHESVSLSVPSSPQRIGDDALATAYNDVPYVSSPDPARHPERHAAIATLYGLDVAPVQTCRILEFACGDGSNLAPIAASLPSAQCIGFDFASAPVARANQMIDALGLRNVRVLELDLRALPEDLGTFDYIIAHGLYSWLPDDARAELLPRIARHLAPNGVAFVSFNAMPGSHLRAIAWDMLRHHTHAMPDHRTKVEAARSLLQLIGEPASDDDALTKALRDEFRRTAQGSESSLAHDDLAEFNHAVQFAEFADEAARAGLAFLADARMAAADAGLGPRQRQMLAQLPRLAREQYLDFLRFRQYRETLLCHAGAVSDFAVDAKRALPLFALPSLATRRAPEVPPSDPAAAALVDAVVSRWPHSVRVADLADMTSGARTKGPDARRVEEVVLAMCADDVLELRCTSPTVAAAAGSRPQAFGPARWLARDRAVVPSVYHEALRFAEPQARKIVTLLDGATTREALCVALGAPFSGIDGRGRLDRALGVLAKKALLVA